MKATVKVKQVIKETVKQVRLSKMVRFELKKYIINESQSIKAKLKINANIKMLK